jgi:hypothetical protein
MNLAVALRAQGAHFPSRVLADGSVCIDAASAEVAVTVTAFARSVCVEAVEPEARKTLQTSSQSGIAWEAHAARCIIEFWPGLLGYRAPRDPEPEVSGSRIGSTAAVVEDAAEAVGYHAALLRQPPAVGAVPEDVEALGRVFGHIGDMAAALLARDREGYEFAIRSAVDTLVDAGKRCGLSIALPPKAPTG